MTGAQLRLPQIFSDHMVLQKASAVSIWGWTVPGDSVQIKGSWGGGAKSTAGKDGKWMAKLGTPKEPGPYTISVNDGDSEKVISDVLMGEVWLCSGQSNMEMMVGQCTNPPALMASFSPTIRHFRVARNYAALPQTDVQGSWEVCSAATVNGFTAAGYFFAVTLQQHGIGPVGLINSTWGGTPVEMWMSDQAVLDSSALGPILKRQPPIPDLAVQTVKNREAHNRADLGNFGEWFGEALDDSAWTPAPITIFQSMGLASFDGLVWFRGNFEITGYSSNDQLAFDCPTIDDDDSVWVNGHLAGTTLGVNVRRTYKIDPSWVHNGTNTVAIRVHDTGGEGGFDPKATFIRTSGKQLPIVNWRFRTSTEQQYLTNVPGIVSGKQNSGLYRGMINPLIPFTIKGALWYQGEANVDRAYQYRTSFPDMIRTWRKEWGQGDFPFYFVQIAPFTYGDRDGGSPAAELREAQFLTMLGVKNTGMVVTTDIAGNVGDIHPQDKANVGMRLGIWALARDYGVKVIPTGPIYKSFRIKDGAMFVNFDTETSSIGGPLKGFTIAGPDRKFYPAQAVCMEKEVKVWAPEVPNPAAVRFSWGCADVGNLFGNGLPASPFRTDNWPAVSQNASW